MTDLFRKLHHICVVVNDIGQAQAWYESIGILPWAAHTLLSEYEDLEVPLFARVVQLWTGRGRQEY